MSRVLNKYINSVLLTQTQSVALAAASRGLEGHSALRESHVPGRLAVPRRKSLLISRSCPLGADFWKREREKTKSRVNSSGQRESIAIDFSRRNFPSAAAPHYDEFIPFKKCRETQFSQEKTYHSRQ